MLPPDLGEPLPPGLDLPGLLRSAGGVRVVVVMVVVVLGGGRHVQERQIQLVEEAEDEDRCKRGLALGLSRSCS